MASHLIKNLLLLSNCMSVLLMD